MIRLEEEGIRWMGGFCVVSFRGGFVLFFSLGFPES